MITFLRTYRLLGLLLGLVIAAPVDASSVPDVSYVPKLTLIEGQEISVSAFSSSERLTSTMPKTVAIQASKLKANAIGRSYLLLPSQDGSDYVLSREVEVIQDNDSEILIQASNYAREKNYFKASRYYEALSLKYPEKQTYAAQSGIYRLLHLMNSTPYKLLSSHWVKQLGEPLPIPVEASVLQASLSVSDAMTLKKILMAPFGVLKESQVNLHKWVPYFDHVLKHELHGIIDLIEGSRSESVTVHFGSIEVTFSPSQLTRLSSRLHFFQGMVKQRLAYDWSSLDSNISLQGTFSGYSKVAINEAGPVLLKEAYLSFLKSAALSKTVPGSSQDKIKFIILGELEPMAFPYYERYSNKRLEVKDKSLVVSVDFKSFYHKPPAHLGDLFLERELANSVLFPRIQDEVQSIEDKEALSLLIDLPQSQLGYYTTL